MKPIVLFVSFVLIFAATIFGSIHAAREDAIGETQTANYKIEEHWGNGYNRTYYAREVTYESNGWLVAVMADGKTVRMHGSIRVTAVK